MTAITVHTQADLDKAIADRAQTIYIESDDGVWLNLNGNGSSHVVARGSSHVVARGSSHVVAWDSSHVVAWGSSHVDAWDSSHVDAWDSSHVVARKYVGVHLHSQRVTLDAQGHVIDLTAIDFSNPAVWCEFHGVTVEDGIAYVYKAVNDEWLSRYKFSYAPGSTPEAPDWHTTPDCGGGLHFSARPSAALEYAPEATRFLKCGVHLDEMVCLGDKIKAKRVAVACVEVDRCAREVTAATVQ